jgi:hypothetical protein
MEPENLQSPDTYHATHLTIVLHLQDRAGNLSMDTRFSENDVRNTFFLKFHYLLEYYYADIQIPYLFQKLGEPFQNGELSQYFDSKSVETFHFQNLGSLAMGENLAPYLSAKRVKFIFSIWMIFEEAIDQIYQHIVTSDDKENAKFQMFNKIRSKLSKKMTEEEILVIKNKLKSDFVSLQTKYNYKFKKIKSNDNGILINNYKEFLSFFNTLRNSFHSNSKPLKTHEFKLSFGTYTFVEGVYVDFFTRDILTNSIETLLMCFEFIRSNVEFNNVIIDDSKPS